MNNVFDTTYARVYDVLYQDKDYLAECDLLEQIFERYATQPVHKILDLGCGTGNHAIPLATRGYAVVGVDCAQEMLNIARVKAQQESLSVSFNQANIGEVHLHQIFDATLMMFAVLGYQLENADVLATLRTAREHLHQDGLLVADVWYGPAVLIQRPGDRVRVIHEPDGTILRTSSGELDIRHHTCKVQYHLWQIKGRQVLAETKEEHLMRFFFPRELELFLADSGFQLLRLGAFPDFNQEPDENTWNAMIVARAV